MMRNPFTHGRYATVASTIALVVALSGTAYAAATITSADIVNSTIQGIDIRDGAVRSADVGNGSITRADLAATAASPRIFAVVEGATNSLLASAGVQSFSHESDGHYTLTTTRTNISACAWLATPGARNGGEATTNNRVITLNAFGDNVIDIVTGLGGSPTDMDFNLAVIC
jgi:hypothetical protein